MEMLGFVEEKKLQELYKGAQAVIAAAEDEDFGIGVVEAQMFGKTCDCV